MDDGHIACLVAKVTTDCSCHLVISSVCGTISRLAVDQLLLAPSAGRAGAPARQFEGQRQMRTETFGALKKKTKKKTNTASRSRVASEVMFVSQRNVQNPPNISALSCRPPVCKVSARL